MDSQEWRDQVYGPDERLHVLSEMPDNPVCPNPKCGYVLSDKDEQDVWRDDGTFSCPQCHRMYQLFDPNEHGPGGGTISNLTLFQVGNIGEGVIRNLGTIPSLGRITEDLSHLGKSGLSDDSGAPDFVVAGDDGVFYAVEVKTNDARAQERFKIGGQVERQKKYAWAVERGMKPVLVGVRLNFYNDQAQVFVQPHGFKDTWYGSANLQHVTTVNFADKNPFKHPAEKGQTTMPQGDEFEGVFGKTATQVMPLRNVEEHPWAKNPRQRVPLVYVPDHDRIYVGPGGSHHVQMRQQLGVPKEQAWEASLITGANEQGIEPGIHFEQHDATETVPPEVIQTFRGAYPTSKFYNGFAEPMDDEGRSVTHEAKHERRSVTAPKAQHALKVTDPKGAYMATIKRCKGCGYTYWEKERRVTACPTCGRDARARVSHTKIIVAGPSVDAIAKEMGWNFWGYTKKGERVYDWVDEFGVRHKIQVGSGQHGKGAAEIDAQKGRARMRQCMKGNCLHGPSEELGIEEGVPEAPLIKPGQEVMHGGKKWWVSEVEGGLVAIYDPWGHQDIVPMEQVKQAAGELRAEPWRPGMWGKGNIYEDGSVEHWVTDKHDEPHHSDMAGYLNGLKRFDISPEGVIYPVVDAIDQRWTGQDYMRAMSAHPMFHGGEEKDTGYGHADKLGAWYEDPDQADWQHGMCDVYAKALTDMYPHLRMGVMGHGDHFFAHDDQHAYDSLGRHPLPYLGDQNQFGPEEIQLDADPNDWGFGYYPFGENGSAEDYERAKALIPQQHPYLTQHTAPETWSKVAGIHDTFAIGDRVLAHTDWGSELVTIMAVPTTGPQGYYSVQNDEGRVYSMTRGMLDLIEPGEVNETRWPDTLPETWSKTAAAMPCMAEIGEPEREWTVEPLEDPTKPEPIPQPTPTPEREKEKVAADYVPEEWSEEKDEDDKAGSTVAGVIYGWKILKVTEALIDQRSTEDLGSRVLLMSPSFSTIWEPGKPQHAPPETIPGIEEGGYNKPGIHAVKEDNLAALYQYAKGTHTVLCKVALWGKVVEHEQGYRAENAYPVEIHMRPTPEDLPVYQQSVEQLADKIRETYGKPVINDSPLFEQITPPPPKPITRPHPDGPMPVVDRFDLHRLKDMATDPATHQRIFQPVTYTDPQTRGQVTVEPQPTKMTLKDFYAMFDKEMGRIMTGTTNEAELVSLAHALYVAGRMGTVKMNMSGNSWSTGREHTFYLLELGNMMKDRYWSYWDAQMSPEAKTQAKRFLSLFKDMHDTPHPPDGQMGLMTGHPLFQQLPEQHNPWLMKEYYEQQAKLEREQRKLEEQQNATQQTQMFSKTADYDDMEITRQLSDEAKAKPWHNLDWLDRMSEEDSGYGDSQDPNYIHMPIAVSPEGKWAVGNAGQSHEYDFSERGTLEDIGYGDADWDERSKMQGGANAVGHDYSIYLPAHAQHLPSDQLQALHDDVLKEIEDVRRGQWEGSRFNDMMAGEPGHTMVIKHPEQGEIELPVQGSGGKYHSYDEQPYQQWHVGQGLPTEPLNSMADSPLIAHHESMLPHFYISPEGYDYGHRGYGVGGGEREEGEPYGQAERWAKDYLTRRNASTSQWHWTKEAMGYEPETWDLPEGMTIQKVEMPGDDQGGKQEVVARLGPTTIGFLSWYGDTIHSVDVSRSYRRKGIASAMKAEAERIAGHPIYHSEALSDDGHAWMSADPQEQATFAKTAMGYEPETWNLPDGIRIEEDLKPTWGGVRQVNAILNGEQIGILKWTDDGWDSVIENVDVKDEYQRMGIASAMLAEAERVTGHRIRHSQELSLEGFGWAKADPDKDRQPDIPAIKNAKTAAPALAEPMTDLDVGTTNLTIPEEWNQTATGWRSGVRQSPQLIADLKLEPHHIMGSHSPPNVSWEQARDFLAERTKGQREYGDSKLYDLIMAVAPEHEFLYEVNPTNNIGAKLNEGWTAEWYIEKMPEGYRNSKVATMATDIRVVPGGDYLDSRDGSLQEGDDANIAVQAWDAGRMVGSLWIEAPAQGETHQNVWQAWIEPPYRGTGLFEAMAGKAKEELGLPMRGYRDKYRRDVEERLAKLAAPALLDQPTTDLDVGTTNLTIPEEWTTEDKGWHAYIEPDAYMMEKLREMFAINQGRVKGVGTMEQFMRDHMQSKQGISWRDCQIWVYDKASPRIQESVNNAVENKPWQYIVPPDTPHSEWGKGARWVIEPYEGNPRYASTRLSDGSGRADNEWRGDL